MAVPALLDRLHRLLPALWAGMLLSVTTIATPAPFATLSVADAGRVVGRVLAHEAWLSLLLAVLLLVMERRKATAAAVQSGTSVLSTELLLVLGAVFCTLVGYFGIQPMMPAARLGQGVFSFGQLHLASTVFFGVKAVLVMVLAWRAAAPAAVGLRSTSAS